MFSSSILFYTKLINDPNTSDGDMKRFLVNIDGKYNFVNCP